MWPPRSQFQRFKIGSNIIYCRPLVGFHNAGCAEGWRRSSEGVSVALWGSSSADFGWQGVVNAAALGERLFGSQSFAQGITYGVITTSLVEIPFCFTDNPSAANHVYISTTQLLRVNKCNVNSKWIGQQFLWNAQDGNRDQRCASWTAFKDRLKMRLLLRI